MRVLGKQRANYRDCSKPGLPIKEATLLNLRTFRVRRTSNWNELCCGDIPFVFFFFPFVSVLVLEKTRAVVWLSVLAVVPLLSGSFKSESSSCFHAHLVPPQRKKRSDPCFRSTTSNRFKVLSVLQPVSEKQPSPITLENTGIHMISWGQTPQQQMVCGWGGGSLTLQHTVHSGLEGEIQGRPSNPLTQCRMRKVVDLKNTQHWLVHVLEQMQFG